ncbi:hypothetical protein BJ928_12820 [Rhizobium sp. WW_1]|nr:hypothetical protein BJ928_12820 [Rhizobium sp. WW_1]
MTGPHIVHLFPGSDGAAEHPATTIEIGFGNDEILDFVSKQVGGFYGNGTAHAVPVDIYLLEVSFPNEAMNLSRMVFHAISEIFRTVAEAKTEQIKKNGVSSTQGWCGDDMRVFE